MFCCVCVMTILTTVAVYSRHEDLSVIVDLLDEFFSTGEYEKLGPGAFTSNRTPATFYRDRESGVTIGVVYKSLDGRDNIFASLSEEHRTDGEKILSDVEKILRS